MPLRMTRRIAAPAAVVIAALLVSAAPALAGTSDASAVGATVKVTLAGKSALDAGPFAYASSSKGPKTNTFAGVDLPGILTTGIINTAAQRDEQSGSVNAKASTADAKLALLKSVIGDVSATLIEAKCETVKGKVAGSTKLVEATLGKLGAVPVEPAPNTVVDVTPLGAQVVKITLNEQLRNDDGSLKVNALHLQLLGGKNSLGMGDVVISSTTCAPESGGGTTPTQTTTAQVTSTSPAAGGAVPSGDNNNKASDAPALAATGASPGLLIVGGMVALIAGFVTLRVVRSRNAISG